MSNKFFAISIIIMFSPIIDSRRGRVIGNTRRLTIVKLRFMCGIKFEYIIVLVIIMFNSIIDSRRERGIESAVLLLDSDLYEAYTVVQ